MRIDKEKFPALFDNNLVLRQYDHLLDDTHKAMLKDVIGAANMVRTYLARPIIEPMLTSYQKLIAHRKELHDSARTLIYLSKQGNPHTIHYTLLVEQSSIVIIGQSCVLLPNKSIFGLLFYVSVDKDDTEEPTFKSFPAVPPIIEIEQHDKLLNVMLNAILAAELFINFAEIETKVMTPNTQIWEDDRRLNALYNNKTNKDITVIDSTWYTNLVSSGAFKVRGHFRLQPFGPDRAQRRLQWISDFQKEGYTRKAKKEIPPIN